MKTKEVRKLTDEEIQVEVKRLRRRLFDLRSQAVTEKIEDTSQFGKTRKDLARILTESNRRRREAAVQAAPAASGGSSASTAASAGAAKGRQS